MTTETPVKKLKSLDPTLEPMKVEAEIAPRSETINGKRLGLLDNGKRNADRLLMMVKDLISEKHELGDVVSVSKSDVSKPASSEIIHSLAERCDIVIVAVGD